ncbi:MAG TPA: hypothetical protein VG652_11850 [Gaiellaceae bacterium]|nr:hypothetical protein [Gaiellaceae bacterium]
MKTAVVIALAAIGVIFVPAAVAVEQASPCSHVSRSAVQSTLGISVSETRSVPNPGTIGLTVCYFETKTNPVAATISFQTASGKATYASNLVQTTPRFAKVLTGLGDKAFYNSSNPGGSTSLQMLKGNILVSFFTPAPLSKVKALAKKVAAAL